MRLADGYGELGIGGAAGDSRRSHQGDQERRNPQRRFDGVLPAGMVRGRFSGRACCLCVAHGGRTIRLALPSPPERHHRSIDGQLRLGLYDDRPDSSSYRSFRMLNLAISRPVAVEIPPLVWHAIKNPASETAAYIVVNDQPYRYEDPDDWTLPAGSEAIPYTLE